MTNISQPRALPPQSPSILQSIPEETKYSGEVELPYGKTKAMAEKLVFKANEKKVQKSMVAPLVFQHRMSGRRQMVRKIPQLTSNCFLLNINTKIPRVYQRLSLPSICKIKECCPSCLCLNFTKRSGALKSTV